MGIGTAKQQAFAHLIIFKHRQGFSQMSYRACSWPKNYELGTCPFAHSLKKIPRHTSPFGIFFRARAQQGMYKNRVKNDRIFFLIPTLLSCKRSNSECRKIQNNNCILNFPTLDFLVCKWEFQKSFLLFFTLFLYILYIFAKLC